MVKTTAKSFINNIIKILVLDSAVYRQVKDSILSATLIVLFVAFSHGIAGIIRAKINHWNSFESFVFGIEGEVVFWLSSSVIYYIIGVGILRRRVKLIEILSSIGYSIFPGVLIIVAALLQLIDLSIPMLIVISIYRFTTSIKALRQTMGLKLITAAILVLVGAAIGFVSLAIGTRISEWILLRCSIACQYLDWTGRNQTGHLFSVEVIQLFRELRRVDEFFIS